MARPTHDADPTGFGAVDDHDADYFVRFLDARTTIPGEIRVKRLITSELRLREGLSVLDVGSGTGADTCHLATVVGPDGSVVGLDRSARMVEESRRRAGALGVPAEFVDGDAASLPFPDATFDRCRAERVLAVIDDPVAAVAEMARVTRPGGLVVVSEIDSGTIFLDGPDSHVADSLVHALASGLPNPRIGRRLNRLLAEAGLADVHCVPQVVLNPVAFLRVVFAGQLEELVATGEVNRAGADAFWAEQERGEHEGWLCTGVTCFTAAGRKLA
ncbi:methyltransferase domain-containing protein [Pseudonocardia acaciae]|uniref:methyltransferase domain-containing protein n=1 Tax=Pseudonocardia acaciae TaxID=551276 RepID=UPI0006877285|nr:methyltransferase domain-containing protein [Pseudonocardia acaciae]